MGEPVTDDPEDLRDDVSDDCDDAILMNHSPRRHYSASSSSVRSAMLGLSKWWVRRLNHVYQRSLLASGDCDERAG